MLKVKRETKGELFGNSGGYHSLSFSGRGGGDVSYWVKERQEWTELILCSPASIHTRATAWELTNQQKAKRNGREAKDSLIKGERNGRGDANRERHYQRTAAGMFTLLMIVCSFFLSLNPNLTLLTLWFYPYVTGFFSADSSLSSFFPCSRYTCNKCKLQCFYLSLYVRHFKVQAHFYFEYCVHVQENSKNIKDFHTSIQFKLFKKHLHEWFCIILHITTI